MFSSVNQIDKKWAAEKFERLPLHFVEPVKKRYEEKLVQNKDGKGRFYANDLLNQTVEAVGGLAADLAGDNGAIIEYAKARAAECFRVFDRIHEQDAALNAMLQICARVGVNCPADKHTTRGKTARLVDDLWWRRGIRTAVNRSVEHAAIRLGLVHRKAGIYASNETVATRQQQKKRNARLLDSIEATNELGQKYKLSDLAALGVANPEIRRAELMTRIAGFEAFADAQQHVGMFYTITAPSSYHARLSISGDINPKYNDTTPREAQAYLVKVWARIRAKLHRQEIKPYGFRVVEAHHDGTPHWHLLLFMAAQDVAEVNAVMRFYALQQDGAEQGAQKNRFIAVTIDKSRGSAAGYIAKYIAKNISNLGGVEDFEDYQTGASAADSSRRVEAWAACWGIRQFQQIGGAAVTVWRELRRLGDSFGGNTDLDRAAAAADAGNWSRYLQIMGSSRKDAPIKLLKVWTDEAGKYGEALGLQIKGLECGVLSVVTRIHQWEMKRSSNVNDGNIERGGVNANDSGMERDNNQQQKERGKAKNNGAAVFLGFEVGADFSPPWSSVNNCTLGENEVRAQVESYEAELKRRWKIEDFLKERQAA